MPLTFFSHSDSDCLDSKSLLQAESEILTGVSQNSINLTGYLTADKSKEND